LNAGRGLLNYRLQFFWLEVICSMSIKRTETWN